MTKAKAIRKATASGHKMAVIYIEEFDRTPHEDGSDKVGDWDSQAWMNAWSDLCNEGATEDMEVSCRNEFFSSFYSN